MKGRITKTGYRRNSPDVNNDFNIIPSNRISMQGVDFPVFGVDNMGNSQIMYPGGEYEFQGDYVTELPAYGSGGLTQWFAEKWVDIKTGKKCGRSGKDKKGRPYPACRPSKRVNSTTPKTSSEMSASEKAKFKRKKKSGKRINYNHKRAQFGGRSGDVFQEVDTYIKPGQNIRPNWAQTPDAVTNYTFGKNLVDDESRFSLGLQGVDILDEIQYRADALGSVGVGIGNRNGKGFRPAGENLRAGVRGQASWQGVPGNVIENMFGRRSGLDWRGSVEGEAGLAYANGAVRPYLSFMPQTNIGIGGNMSIGIGAEMRGRYDNKGSLAQKDAYSGMSRGSGRYSLKYDMGDGDFIEGYYAPSDPFFQGETLGVRNVFALESKQPRFGVRLRKSFAKGGSLDRYQTKGEVSFQSLDPRLQGNNTDATYVNVNQVDPYIVNRSEAQRLTDENPQGTITTYEEPSTISKVLNRAAHPFATASYIANNQRLPDRVGDGFGGRAASMDLAASFVNPADLVYYGIEGVKDIARGNYASGALNVLGAIPAIPSAAVTRKVAKEVVTSPTGKLYRTTLVDPFRPRYLDNQLDAKRLQQRNLGFQREGIEDYYAKLEREAVDSKNLRSENFMQFRDKNPEVFNAYNNRRITQLTPFKTKDAYNKRSVFFSERGIDNQFLQQVSNNFNPDISVKGLKPKSLESPLFQNLNTKSSLTDLQTGLTKDFTISPPQLGGRGFKFDNNLNTVVPNQYKAEGLVGVPIEARNIVRNNISTLESGIPGFKVMGSSKGFADAGFPSFPKDYDGIMTQSAYDKYVKKQYDLIDGSGVANVHRVKINNTPLDIDFNIIQQNSKGIAEGRLAEQLFRKADPDNYFRQSEAVVSGKQKGIRIPYTPEELLSKTDFTKQSIADAFEIPSSKAKHVNRPDIYLSYGDADKVLDAQKSYAQSMIGSKAYLPPQYSSSEFADIAKNKRLLGDMKFAGDINTVAQDPTKMQAVLNDFYFSNTTLSRGIDINSLKNNATARQALTEWNPAAGGGSYAGAGLNNTLLGETGYGNVYGQKQFKLNLNNSTPSDLVSEVRKLSLENNLDPNQMKAANDVLTKYGLSNSGVQTKGEFLQKITSAGPDALTDYYKATGSPFISGNPYGESIYAGSANVFNPSQDLLAMGFKNPNLSGSIPVGKSWMVRSRNAADNPNFYFEDKLMNLNSDQYSLLYNRLNTPTVDGMREGIDKAIRRSLNQPGDYTDRLLDAMQLKGGLSPNQKIQQGIKLREVEDLTTKVGDEISSLNRRINNADRLRRPLVYGTMGTVVGGAVINKAMNDRDAWRDTMREEGRQADLQRRKKAGIPTNAVRMTANAFEKYSQEKLKERFGNVTPMYVEDVVYLIPSKQDGGEKSIREKSNEKFGKSNAFSEYISNPTRIAVIEGAERLDDTPRSNTGVGDNVTSSLINQAIYGNPLTVGSKLEALQKTKDWTFENIRPVQYPSIFNYMMSAGNAVAGKLGLTEGNAPPARDSEGDLMIDEEMYAKVMGVPHKSKYISESKYKPSQAKDSNAKYYTVDWDSMIDKKKLINYASENKLGKGENMVVNSLAPFLKEGYMPEDEFKNIDPLQNFTIGIGEDDKGKYLSIYDKYDFNKTFNTVTSPFEIYDRFYMYESGGEQLSDYSKYDTQERAWFAARKELGKGKMFMYGGQKYSTSTPKGL